MDSSSKPVTLELTEEEAAFLYEGVRGGQFPTAEGKKLAASVQSKLDVLRARPPDEIIQTGVEKVG